MKYKNQMNKTCCSISLSTRTFLWTIFIVATCVSTLRASPAEAHESLNIKGQPMSKTEMQRATAAFVPDETTFAVRLNLETLKSFGCTYESGDENQLKHLEKIITSVKSSIATERQTFEPRFAIYASLADGDQITIVIHKSNSKFYAEIIQSATSQKIHTLIDSSLASEIYSLVRNFKLTPGGNLDSSNCAEFMEKISLE